jgi:hypothetical protein
LAALRRPARSLAPSERRLGALAAALGWTRAPLHAPPALASEREISATEENAPVSEPEDSSAGAPAPPPPLIPRARRHPPSARIAKRRSPSARNGSKWSGRLTPRRREEIRRLWAWFDSPPKGGANTGPQAPALVRA